MSKQLIKKEEILANCAAEMRINSKTRFFN